MADQLDSSQASEPEHLAWYERLPAGLFGLAVLVLALVIVFSPPEHSELISSCMATAPNDCVQSVSAVPETVTSTLIGAGVILILLAVLGIRFTSIKAAGIELGVSTTTSSPQDAQQAAGEGKVVPLAPPIVAQRMFEGAPAEPAAASAQLQTWNLMPLEIQRGVFRRWQADGRDGHPSTNIVQVYSPLPGNQDWYVQFVDGTTYRVTTASSS